MCECEHDTCSCTHSHCGHHTQCAHVCVLCARVGIMYVRTYLCVTGACCTQCAYIYGICVYVCVPEMSMCVLEMCVSPGGCAYYKQCAYACVNVCVCVNQKCLCVYEKDMCV